MPVRRPGGKYRGLIARNKSDADLVKEAKEVTFIWYSLSQLIGSFTSTFEEYAEDAG